jgi:Uma2 family endonuclease
MNIKIKSKLGPHSQGRRMSLKTFEFAEVEEGYLYELARGYIVVSEVPSFFHACILVVIRDALVEYKTAHPGLIYMILGTMDCKLLVPEWESERHPDLAVYLKAPAGPKNRTMWRKWIPEFVIEIVSAGSAERDYVQKREEYWSLGIKEYWIVDARAQKVTTLRRGKSDWIEKELHADDTCETKLLPGFSLLCQAIFDAAAAAGEEE